MKKEDKNLLLKYLCMALPYGVIILHEGWNYEWDESLSTIELVVGIDENWIYTKVIDGHTGEKYREDSHSIDLFDDKPYLRSMSSMTRTELHEVQEILGKDAEICDGFIDIVDSSRKRFTFLELQALFEWFLKNHFDFMDLIPKKLAIKVTEENNPYNIITYDI